MIIEKSVQEDTMSFDVTKLKWTREPADYAISEERIEIITNPHTDLWQRTYYHFRNDCGMVVESSSLEFMHVVQKIRLSKLHLPIWN